MRTIIAAGDHEGISVLSFVFPKHLLDKFPVQLRNLVSRKIVRELVMTDVTAARGGDNSRCEFDDLCLGGPAYSAPRPVGPARPLRAEEGQGQQGDHRVHARDARGARPVRGRRALHRARASPCPTPDGRHLCPDRCPCLTILLTPPVPSQVAPGTSSSGASAPRRTGSTPWACYQEVSRGVKTVFAQRHTTTGSCCAAAGRGMCAPLWFRIRPPVSGVPRRE
jgi:hypothetical protein